MSSATSIDPAARRPGTSTAKTSKSRTTDGSPRAADAPDADPGMRPWQFFVLAGMLSATAVVIVATGQAPAAIIILSLTVMAASLVAIGVHRALAPLARPESVTAPQLLGGRTRAALEREKTLVLRAIKDLEFDFAMKKISQTDFDDLGGRLRARAIGLIQQLDAGSGYRRTIEQELEQRLAATEPRKHGAVATEPREQATETRHHGETARAESDSSDDASAMAEPESMSCASCGQNNDADARFCKHCGTRLSG